MEELAIRVDHLTKTYKLYENNKRRIIEGLFPFAKPKYKEFNALDDVSFQVKKGEIVGIIGRNGSGKSTMLKIITGVLNASAGSVMVNGRISALLELGAGFNPEYTGVENIYLSGTLNRVTREEMGKRIDDIADFAGIGDFIDQPVKNYSSGMYVRLAFAVAVYSDPDILIVDEALSVGDAAFQAKCMARMHQIMNSGATVLFVTHDMNTVKRLCQRCIYLEDGIKIMEGAAEELADIYLRKIRANMNEEHLKIEEQEQNQENISAKTDEETDDAQTVVHKKAEAPELVKKYMNPVFMKKTERFLEGTGSVVFLDMKLMNEKGEEIISFEYDQEIRIWTRLVVNEDAEFVVGYHIRDDKSTELLGSSTKMEGKDLISGKRGEVYDIEFVTRLPLVEGNYNVTILASKPVIKNRSALFLAYMENAAVFSVAENQRDKLWDKVYIPNNVNIEKVRTD